jgi:hypothetical protein
MQKKKRRVKQENGKNKRLNAKIEANPKHASKHIKQTNTNTQHASKLAQNKQTNKQTKQNKTKQILNQRGLHRRLKHNTSILQLDHSIPRRSGTVP